MLLLFCVCVGMLVSMLMSAVSLRRVDVVHCFVMCVSVLCEFSFLLVESCNRTMDFFLSPPQMGVQGCAMGMGNASWGRTAGTVSVTLAGEARDAMLPWRPPATTTKTMKAVRWKSRFIDTSTNTGPEPLQL